MNYNTFLDPTTKPMSIEKEIISKMIFPKTEVLDDEQDIENRRTTLEAAMKLGNNHRHKATIIFEDSETVKQVETTIWGVTAESVLLKRGLVIPICRVHQVMF
jgi:polysaccharide deacetylase 2 family uncharacterized protein YibQ